MEGIIKIVVDTNIVFSAMLNLNSRIGGLLLSSHGKFKFYSCEYQRIEIDAHRSRIQNYRQLDDIGFEKLRGFVERPITFIKESIIPQPRFAEAEELVRDVDFNDLAFVALANHLGALLWTGDKVLTEGLRKKGYMNVVSTVELQELAEGKQSPPYM